MGLHRTILERRRNAASRVSGHRWRLETGGWCVRRESIPFLMRPVSSVQRRALAEQQGKTKDQRHEVSGRWSAVRNQKSEVSGQGLRGRTQDQGPVGILGNVQRSTFNLQPSTFIKTLPVRRTYGTSLRHENGPKNWGLFWGTLSQLFRSDGGAHAPWHGCGRCPRRPPWCPRAPSGLRKSPAPCGRGLEGLARGEGGSRCQRSDVRGRKVEPGVGTEDAVGECSEEEPG